MSTIAKRVRVQRASAGKIWIEASIEASCSACGVQSRCGVSALGRAFSRHRAPVALPTSLAARAGDELVLELPQARLLQAALLAYLLPAALAVAGAALAGLIAGGDRAAALGAGLGVVAGLAIARRSSRTTQIAVRRVHESSTYGENP
ncbi:MAG: SoxR reducing system RseC family protein [Thiotrichales bacterium]